MLSGEVIAIMDSGFDVSGYGSNTTTHQKFSGKTITELNTSYFVTYMVVVAVLAWDYGRQVLQQEICYRFINGSCSSC